MRRENTNYELGQPHLDMPGKQILRFSSVISFDSSGTALNLLV